MEGGKNSSNSCGAVPVRCGPVPLTSALWPPRRPHVPPACQYRLALRVAVVPSAPVAMRDAYPWPQGTTGEDRVSRLKFSLSERLRRLQAAAARGLTRFVGRQQELAALQQALVPAGGGSGQMR